MRVLLLDRDAMIRSLVRSYLADQGAKVDIAPDDASKIWHLLSRQQFDLIVIDLRQRDPDGGDVFEAARASARNARTPVVMIAGNVRTADIETVKRDGRATLLAKPFSGDVFLDAVARCFALARRQPPTSGAPPAEAASDSAVEPDLAVIEGGRDDTPASSRITGAEESAFADSSIGAADDPKHSGAGAGAPPDVHHSQERDADPWTRAAVRQRLDDVKTLIEASQEQMRAIFTAGLRPQSGGEQPLDPEHLPLGRVLIVDRDESMRKILAQYLRSKSALDVAFAADGADAWRALGQEPCQLVIMEWRLDKVSGLCLYNRIRAHPELKNTPIIVLTGFVSREDFRILDESDLTVFLEKPFQEKIFTDALVGVMQAGVMEGDAHDDVARIVAEIVLEGEAPAAEALKELLTELPGTHRHLRMAAEYLMQARRFAPAEAILRTLSSLSRGDPGLWTQLARLLHLTGRSDEALGLLGRAHLASPHNVERLCLLGEVGLTLTRPKEAAHHLREALRIDPGHTRAKAGLHLASNMKEYIAEHQVPMATSLAGMLNTIGVTLAKNHHAKRAHRHYMAAMAFVDDPMTLAKIHYNLALSYLRRGDRERSYRLFRRAYRLAGGRYDKARGYLERLHARRRRAG